MSDKLTGEIVRWDKTRKGISLKGNKGALAMSSLPKYQNPVIYYCTVLQYGNVESYSNVLDL